jgi:hypothetical protein
VIVQAAEQQQRRLQTLAVRFVTNHGRGPAWNLGVADGARAWAPFMNVRHNMGTSAAAAKAPDHDEYNEGHQVPAVLEKEVAERGDDPQTVLSKYWGIMSKTYNKEDGSTWAWNCFRVSSLESESI